MKMTPPNSPDPKYYKSPPFSSPFSSPSPSPSSPSQFTYLIISYSNLFEVLNILVTNALRKVATTNRKLVRLYHPDNWNTKSLSKLESEEKFKKLVNVYDDIIDSVHLS